MNQDVSSQRSNIEKRRNPGMTCVTLTRTGCTEQFFTFLPLPDETPSQFYQRAADCLKNSIGNVISIDIFDAAGQGGQFAKDTLAMFNEKDITAPVTWVTREHESTLYGMHAWTITGLDITPIEVAGRRLGSAIEDDTMRLVRLGGVSCTDTSLSREEQAANVFETMGQALATKNMVFGKHVARTWFYNDDILDWYGPFNTVRDTYFKAHQVFDQLVPASTGIGGGNPNDSAMMAGLLAIDPKNDTVQVHAVPSPLQCPALEYGSSFSRAVEIVQPGLKRLTISGTASIEPGGETVHLDDTVGQIKLTMEVAGAILESRGMNWANAVRVLAYFRNPEEAHLYEAYLKENNIEIIPAVITDNTVCRDDLLFEIELDAVILTD